MMGGHTETGVKGKSPTALRVHSPTDSFKGRISPGQEQGRPGQDSGDFESFFKETEPRLTRALVACYGSDDGREAAAEALAYAWEHWEKVKELRSPVAYLYRTGQSRTRRWRRRPSVAFATPAWSEHRYEPALPIALSSLTDRQRVAVVLVYGYEWTIREVAELMDASHTTVQKHLERGLTKLRSRLGSHG